MDKSLWNDEELAIFELFKNRCALNPAHKAEVLHEIIPKSQAPKNWDIPTNRIPLCVVCHTNVHHNYDSLKRNYLQILRLEAEYANIYTE